MIEIETGGLNLSIPTSIAIEVLFNIGSKELMDGKDIIKYKHYEMYIFNIHTLVINILASVTNKDVITRSDIMVKVYSLVRDEMSTITDVCNEHKLKVVFYAPSYRMLSKFFKDSGNSKVNLFKTLDITDYIYNRLITENNSFILNNDRGLKLKLGEVKKVLITTHYPIDLLNNKYFPIFDLLESHTGRVINRFNNKYNKLSSVDFTLFPFNELLLYIIGDRYMIKPMGLSIRRGLGELYDKHKWRINTSDGIIKSNLLKQEIYRKIIKITRFKF